MAATSSKAAAARRRARFRKIGRYSLLVLVALLLVLPAISPRADVVARIVSPIVEAITRFLLAIFGLQL